MVSGAIDYQLHRDIIEVLVADFENDTSPPISLPGISRDALACTWGFYAQVHRLGRSLLLLIDNDMEHETHIIARVALEYTIMLHWIVERKEAAVKAILASQSNNIKRHVKLAQEAEMFLPPEVEREMRKAEIKPIDDAKAVGTFKTVCKELGALELYFVYGVESGFVHPSLVGINSYIDSRGNPANEPQRVMHRSNISLLAYCLIWANRDLDSLTPGRPRADGLERLANTVEAIPALPVYRELSKTAQKNRQHSNEGRRKK
jgi:hypothetical protein